MNDPDRATAASFEGKFSDATTLYARMRGEQETASAARLPREINAGRHGPSTDVTRLVSDLNAHLI